MKNTIDHENFRTFVESEIINCDAYENELSNAISLIPQIFHAEIRHRIKTKFNGRFLQPLFKK